MASSVVRVVFAAALVCAFLWSGGGPVPAAARGWDEFWIRDSSQTPCDGNCSRAIVGMEPGAVILLWVIMLFEDDMEGRLRVDLPNGVRFHPSPPAWKDDWFVVPDSSSIGFVVHLKADAPLEGWIGITFGHGMHVYRHGAPLVVTNETAYVPNAMGWAWFSECCERVNQHRLQGHV